MAFQGQPLLAVGASGHGRRRNHRWLNGGIHPGSEERGTACPTQVFGQGARLAKDDQNAWLDKVRLRGRHYRFLVHCSLFGGQITHFALRALGRRRSLRWTSAGRSRAMECGMRAPEHAHRLSVWREARAIQPGETVDNDGGQRYCAVEVRLRNRSDD